MYFVKSAPPKGKNRIQPLLDKIVQSEEKCVEIPFEQNEYKNIASQYASVARAIERSVHRNRLRAHLIKAHIYIVRI